MQLQQVKADDYVIATGTSTTVRDFATAAFREAGIKLDFSKHGEDEQAVDSVTGKVILRVNSKFFRPVDSHQLIGDPSKAKRILDWTPDIAGIRVAELLTRAEITQFI